MTLSKMTKDTTPVTPLKVVNNSQDHHSTIEAKKKALEEQKALLEAEEQALIEAEQKAQEKAKQEQLTKIDSLFQNAEMYENWAKEELAKKPHERDNGQAEAYMEIARERKAEARKLQLELGIQSMATEPVETNETDTQSRHPWWTPFAQIGGLFLLLWVCVQGFFDTQKKISAHNAVVEPFAQVRAHDLDSVQKLFFEKMTIGTDLLIMLGIIGVISPVIFIYIVPIIKSKRDFLNEFNNDLTAWQRGLLTSIILSAVLLYLGLSHSVRM